MAMNRIFAGLSALACASLVAATAIPGVSVGGNLMKRATPCEHGPNSRQCWGNYDINTDYMEVTPDTGVTREYWLEAQEIISAPDGYERQVLVFNGTSPGPTIEANWGDWIVVHVKNAIPHNGTAVHWHGVRMLNNVENDGVPGVTQCGIAPGDTMTYRFRAQQYGTSWYHSHFSYQAVDGLSGPIIIHGPATANYDEHKGALFLTDWAHETATKVWLKAMMRGLFPIIPNGLINGTNVYDCRLWDKLTDPKCKGTGQRFKMEFEQGKKYRIGLVGTQADGFLRFSLDGHKFTVISMDFVPIEPFEATSLLIGGGQRYDIVVHANQPPGNYWLRSTLQACNVQLNENGNNIKGIVTYKGVPVAEPKTKSWNVPNNCLDVDAKQLRPKVPHTVGPAATRGKLNLSWYYDLPEGIIFHWTLNSTALKVDWAHPTLKVINDGNSVFPTSYNIHPVTVKNQWVYWIIQDLAIINAFHPMHLHGHDLYVLGQGRGLYVPGISKLNTDNPPRRDTAILPGNGWMVMAFYTDNPGAWLMHCHIAWHASQGFALQFVEREGEIAATVKNGAEMDANCKRWEEYEERARYEQDDSGI